MDFFYIPSIKTTIYPYNKTAVRIDSKSFLPAAMGILAYRPLISQNMLILMVAEAYFQSPFSQDLP